MANLSCTADALLYASGSTWHSGSARQGVYSSTRFEGAISFSGLSDLPLGIIDISQITFSVTFGPKGNNSTKYLTLCEATSNTVSGTVAAMRGEAIGALSVPEAYDRTETFTFSTSVNAGLFAHLKQYFLAGNRVLMLYVPTTRGTSHGCCYDYLAVTAAAIHISYSYLKSTGTLRATTVPAGVSAVLDITSYDSSYTHRLVWTFGSHTKTQTLAAGETSASSLIPMSWLDAIPSSSSGPASVMLETQNASGTSIGKASYSFQVRAPASVRPSIGSLLLSPVNTNSAINGWGLYVFGKTRASVQINGASGIYGSTIRSYSIELSQGCGNRSAVSMISPVLNKSGTISVTATVVDTRGRSATKTGSFTVYPYAPPVVTSVEAYRCTSNGTRNDATGTYAYVKASFACSSVNGNNSISGCTLTLSQVGGSYSVSRSLTSGTGVVVGGGSLESDSVYRVTLAVTDAVGTTTNHVVDIPSAAYVMHIKKGGKAVGFGMAAGSDNTASFGWPVKLSTPLEVSQGGTGSTTAAGACSALGAVKKSGDTMTGSLNIQGGTNPGVVMYPSNSNSINLAYVQADANGSASIAAWDDSVGDTRRMLELRTKTAQSNMDYAFVLRVKENGSWTTHRIFHAGAATPIPIANGGTGASGAKAALTNLGIFYAASLPSSGTDGQICLVPV